MASKMLNAVLMVVFTLGVCRLAASTATTSLKTNPAIIHFSGVHVSNKAQVRFNSAYGNFLQIASDGTVNGTDTCASKYAKLEQQTLGDGHMHIKGVETGRYIAMNNKGELFSSTSANDETIFLEEQTTNGFNIYASSKYYKKKPYDVFIALLRTNKPENGKNTSSSQNRVRFVVIPADSC